MKIIHLSTSAQVGGAGIAAHRLHTGLRSLGVDSGMLVAKHNPHEERIYTPDNRIGKLAAQVIPLLDRLPGQLSSIPMDRISSSWAPNRLRHRVNVLKPDILNLHWVNGGFMRIETLAKFHQPIVWTLHDMWAFSGGEHYVGSSVRYKEGYNAKNNPEAESKLDIHRWIWARKYKSWKNLNHLTLACPSQWLANCVKESKLFKGFSVEVLPNGVDHERFRPMDHKAARRILGLPVDKKLILFGAGSATSDPRKGFHLLVQALKNLDRQIDTTGYELVVFGSSSSTGSFSMKTHYLGSLQDSISMALVYAACDVFVAPSLEDNLPNTVLESLSCGTPVVTFDIGGMPDMISHTKNGYLAPKLDTEELAKGLHWVVDDNRRWKQLAIEARSTVERDFTLQCCASRYTDLYKEILSGTG